MLTRDSSGPALDMCITDTFDIVPGNEYVAPGECQAPSAGVVLVATELPLNEGPLVSPIVPCSDHLFCSPN